MFGCEREIRLAKRTITRHRQISANDDFLRSDAPVWCDSAYVCSGSLSVCRHSII